MDLGTTQQGSWRGTATYFIVSTPLGTGQRCRSMQEVKEIVGEYMEGRDRASLEKVVVIEVPLLETLENGFVRPPWDFWP